MNSNLFSPYREERRNEAIQLDFAIVQRARAQVAADLRAASLDSATSATGASRISVPASVVRRSASPRARLARRAAPIAVTANTFALLS